MRQSTAAVLVAVSGVVLCTAVALPWYSRRVTKEPSQQILLDADPNRWDVGRRFEGWWFPPPRAGGEVLLLGALSTFVAVFLAGRQDRLDDPAARRLAGVAAGGFGMASFYSALRLAVGPENWGGWAASLATPTNLALCLGAAVAATVFAVVAIRSRRSIGDPPPRA